MIRKFIFISLGILVGFILVEGLLRLAGFGYYATHKKPEAASSGYKVFCVGESSTWGVGASNPGVKGYPHQLEKRLRKKFFHKQIRVFFDDTIGQNTSEILQKMPGYIKKYQPDLIIFMVGANNWWNLDKSNILLFSKNNLVSDLTLKTIIFLDKFRTWKLFKWLYYSFAGYKERWDHYFSEEEPIVDLEKKLNKNFGGSLWKIANALAEHDLIEMVKIVQANGIEAIICTYPAEPGIDSIHRNVAEEFDVPLVDNSKIFEKLSNREQFFSNDGWHPNDKGYNIVAENIFNSIVDNNLFE